MPRYSEPLYTDASQFINGFDSVLPTPPRYVRLLMS